MSDESGPTHKPGKLTKAMCAVAAKCGMGYYNALNGDAWSPDYPGLSTDEAEERMADFTRDCANRGIKDWRAIAKDLGYQLYEWPNVD